MCIYRKKKIRGFSLIEVLVAILLLAGMISVVVQLSYNNTRRMKKTAQIEKAASLLEQKMQELEEEFKGKKLADLPLQNKGEFDNEKSYSWAYKTQSLQWPQPDRLLSLIQIPEDEWSLKLAHTLTEVLSKSVVELKLTVYYQKNKKQITQYSLVSYMINYEDAPDFIFYHLRNLLPSGLNL